MKPEALPANRTELPRNIILAGFMGTGKSTVGRILADRLGWKFVDTDRLIESEAGLTITEIFDADGEAAFRDLETAVARRLAGMSQCVVATGGGFPLRPENREAAIAAGEVFLLVAPPEEIWQRIGHTRHRPLLQADDPMARIRSLLKEREPAYLALPRKIETRGLSSAEVAGMILQELGIA